MGNALRKDIAVFHQVPTKSVDALGALTHQEIAGSEHDAVRLLLFLPPLVESRCGAVAVG